MKTIAEIIHNENPPLEIFDSNGNEIYWEVANGLWVKQLYDNNAIRIYYEDSTGYISDLRE